MNKRLARRGTIGLRVLAIALMLSAAFSAAGPRVVSAQDDESGLDGNTFTGPNFGWSVEWDEDVWAFEEEDNSGGSDYVRLTTVEDDPFALAQFFGAAEFGGDPDDCVAGWEEFIVDRDGVSDVEEDTTVDLPETPDDGANTAYTYVSESGGTELDVIEYVACQTLIEDEAVLIHTVLTTPDVFEDLIPLIDDLAAEITLPDDTGSRDEDDGDVTPDADDEDVTPESDDEDITPDAEDEDEDEDVTPEAEDEDVTPDADDEEDVTPETEDEETPEADEESGIDGNEYVGPNFGWELTWDEDIWTVDTEDNSDGIDFISLASEDTSAFVLFQGIEAFDGDPDACAEDWGDLIETRGDAEDVEEAPELDVPDAPRGATGAVYTYTIELEDGETLDIVEYIQCYELVEGEAVLEVVLQATEDEYEDAIPLFEDLVAELDIA